MITLDIIRKPVAADLEEFDAFVARQFTAEGDLLEEMLRYALSSRGKGIRPTLVMLSAAMNAPVKTERLGPRVSLAAMLVEMIHVASLIHDDVIDESAERRCGRYGRYVAPFERYVRGDDHDGRRSAGRYSGLLRL